MDPKRTYGKVIKILCIIKIKNNLTDQDSQYLFLILHLNTDLEPIYLYFYQCITLFIFLYYQTPQQRSEMYNKETTLILGYTVVILLGFMSDSK